MKSYTRRSFLKRSASSGAVMASSVLLSQATAYSQIAGSNDAVRIAVIGLRSKGAQHVEIFRNLPGVRVTALCDADNEILQKEVKKFSDRNERVKGYVDVRFPSR